MNGAMKLSHDYRTALCFATDHPSLPGHFPGQPLVPGVLLLEQVALALRAWRNQRMTRVLEAKFVAPLLPGERAQLHLSELHLNEPQPQETNRRIRFEIRRDHALLARGTIEGEASENHHAEINRPRTNHRGVEGTA